MGYLKSAQWQQLTGYSIRTPGANEQPRWRRQLIMRKMTDSAYLKSGRKMSLDSEGVTEPALAPDDLLGYYKDRVGEDTGEAAKRTERVV